MNRLFAFDENDSWFKSPVGALKTGEKLRLRVLIDRRATASVRAVITRDGESGAKMEYILEYAGIKGSYGMFEVWINPMVAGLYWLYFEIKHGGGSFFADKNGETKTPDSPFQITVYKPSLDGPDWLKGGIMYQIFVDRFCKGADSGFRRDGAVYRDDWSGTPEFRADQNGIVRNNDFFGGNLEGIIEKLPMLESLGVTCLYLNPIFEAASNHKYDTGDYMKIDPGFGDEEVFSRLCREAGALGIRIILDGVFNHVGEDSRYFNRYGSYDSLGAYQSINSPYYDWFCFKNWNTDYEAWWGIKLLPAINKRNEHFKRFIAGKGGVIEHWMKLGAYGWRLDVVDELPDELLDPICAAVKAYREDALIIGEVWEDASNKIAYGRRRHYLQGGQIDSVMNYPLKEAIIAFLKSGEAQPLAETMTWLTVNYPKPVLDSLMNILGTHDTIRILSELGGDSFPNDKESMSVYRLSGEQRQLGLERLKLACVLQFTLPGVPCIYYGDEAGMEGLRDPFNRACYPWGNENKEIFEWYRNLAGIRKKLCAFAEGIYTPLCERDGVFAFSRGQGEERIIVAVNVSEKPARLPVSGPVFEHLTRQWRSAPVVEAAGASIFTMV